MNIKTKNDLEHYNINELIYEAQLQETYTEHILNNISDIPQNVFQLSRGLTVESRPFCLEIERLIEEGFLKLHHQDGLFFQHKYFIKNSNEQNKNR